MARKAQAPFDLTFCSRPLHNTESINDGLTGAILLYICKTKIEIDSHVNERPNKTKINEKSSGIVAGGQGSVASPVKVLW